MKRYGLLLAMVLVAGGCRKGPPDSEEPEPYRKVLAEIGEVGGKLLQEGGPKEAAAMTWELERLKTRYSAQLATLVGDLAIATANPAGSYHPLGVRLAEALGEVGIPAAAFSTTGSGENVDLLRRRFVSAAIVQSDILAQAWDGRGLFSADLPWRDLRALGALFPEAVQIVAADPGIRSLADLAGRRVAIGVPGSGSHVDALRVLEAGGMSLDDMQLLPLPLDEAAQGVIDGDLDVLVTTTAYPSPLLRRVAASRSVHLVSLDEQVVAGLGALAPAMIPVQIPAGTYAGQDGPIRTVGVTAVLVTRKDVPWSGGRWV